MKLIELLGVEEGTQLKIDERVVTFGRQAFPKSGHVVYMAGGPGAGKGFVIKNIIPIDAKILNIDSAIEASAKMLAIFNGKAKDIAKRITEIDPETMGKIEKMGEDALKDPEVTFALHKALDKKYDKFMDQFFRLATSRTKPNILVDGTGKSIHKKVAKTIIPLLKSLGYETTLVYVHADPEKAWKRNLKRTRAVPEEIFREIHSKVESAVKASIPYFDNVWYVDTTLEEPQWWIKYPERIIKVK